MSHFVVDIESDGPCPPLYSMVSVGVVKVTEELDKTFYGETAPISEFYNPEALAISEIDRITHLTYPNAKKTIRELYQWVKDNNTGGRPIFWSDNLAFDWGYINYYFHKYCNDNPFGWSGRRIGDVYCGLNKDAYSKWKHLRKTKHTHNPVDDAMGNAEVLLHMKNNMGFKIGFK